jgi:predicted nucleotidyltransferase
LKMEQDYKINIMRMMQSLSNNQRDIRDWMKSNQILRLRLQLTVTVVTTTIAIFWVTRQGTKLQEKRRTITTVKSNYMAIAGFK